MSVAIQGPAAGRAAERAVARARAAAPVWASTPLATRLGILRAVRRGLARSAERLAAAADPEGHRAPGETLTAEVIPLADAIRFLERRAPRLLRSRSVGRRGRPLWLAGASARVDRVPHGTVLVIGPSNYPLLLPGVQVLQALAAGNVVVVKPGAGGRAAIDALAALLGDAGLPAGAMTALDESVEAAEAAMDAGVDHVVLTGSSATASAVLRRLADLPTSATVEAGGCDAVFVRDDADLDLVARALAFGLRLNGGATCIAPRRVFVPRGRAVDLERRLRAKLAGVDALPVRAGVGAQVAALIDDASRRGARLVVGDRPDADRMRPIVLAGARPEMEVARCDVFAPILALYETSGDTDALRQHESCPYALGASVFGEPDGAVRLARRLRVGTVTVNDLIVPTADPRLPFGGRGLSGQGVTRGAEGLLEMTVPRTVAVRSGRARPHYDDPPADAVGMFHGYLTMVHGAGLPERWRGLRRMMRAARAARRGETR